MKGVLHRAELTPAVSKALSDGLDQTPDVSTWLRAVDAVAALPRPNVYRFGLRTLRDALRPCVGGLQPKLLDALDGRYDDHDKTEGPAPSRPRRSPAAPPEASPAPDPAAAERWEAYVAKAKERAEAQLEVEAAPVPAPTVVEGPEREAMLAALRNALSTIGGNGR
jgi:hypothetical protein